jgi:hypothetical protein
MFVALRASGKKKLLLKHKQRPEALLIPYSKNHYLIQRIGKFCFYGLVELLAIVGVVTTPYSYVLFFFSDVVTKKTKLSS